MSCEVTKGRHFIVNEADHRRPPTWTRWCLFCGNGYNRTAFLEKLQRDIRDRSRLPKSPWSAQERSEDL